jgi:hypothetical protein
MLQYVQSQVAGRFYNPQWIVTPLMNDKYLIVLSGNVNIGLFSVGSDPRPQDTVWIYTDVDIQSVLNYSGAPAPPPGYDLRIDVEQYASYANISGFQDNNGGAFLRYFTPIFATNTRYLLGIESYVGVEEGSLSYLAYQITVVARIIPVKIEPIH